jgi:hypothetical protein
MTRGALWLLVVFAAAAAGYLVGARKGEGPGNPTAPATAIPPPSPGREPPSGPAAYLRDDLDRGGAMGLLGGLLRGLWGATAQEAALGIVKDEDAFAAAFAPRVKGPVLDGRTGGTEILDGTTLAFPEGVFELRWSWGARFPRDLVIRGAGRDRTLVRIIFGQVKSDEVHGFTLVDLTVDCQGHELLGLRPAGSAGRPPPRALAAVRLERCRVAKFSTMLVADAAAFSARECEFEGSGKLFRLERGLARLEGCTLRGYVATHDGTGQLALRSRQCSFVDAPPDYEANLKARAGVRLEECTFKTAPGIVPPRPLSSFNPAWSD